MACKKVQRFWEVDSPASKGAINYNSLGLGRAWGNRTVRQMVRMMEVAGKIIKLMTIDIGAQQNHMY